MLRITPHFSLLTGFEEKEQLMITTRPSEERGHFKADWLETRHTFSFDTYHDPRHMRFRSLRVINEDHVAPGRGFPMHHHANMEVITIVVSGQLKHEDDAGHSAVVAPWEVQRFSAGTGIRHSEFNPSETEEVHLLQIWILPEREGLPPSYEQKRLSPELFAGKLGLIASRDGRDGSVTVHQDVSILRGELNRGDEITYPVAEGRHAWLQVISGQIEVNGKGLSPGDGAAISDESELKLTAGEKASFLLFDLA
jgi:quercetin 2,3-dioxygenase